ncbi:hypothetical protein K3495_g5080 [Podosphaera aphanis]|nr:hypothetical protein K3495_g5080 [Podosphaera aphanis]
MHCPLFIAQKRWSRKIYANYGNDKRRAIIKEATLPVEVCFEAAKTHAYITNRIRPGPATKRLIDRQEIIKHVSPEEAWMGNSVTIRHFKVFGCKAFGHIDRKSYPKGSRKDKLMDLAREYRFMGYKILQLGLVQTEKALIFEWISADDGRYPSAIMTDQYPAIAKAI